MASVTLQSGSKMPLNGFGTWKATAEETETATLAALEAGYRHIDCAAVYLNEAHVGRAFSTFFSRGTVSRSEVFITSKVWNTCHATEHVVASCRQSLKDLQLEYLDLYLVHHPFSWRYGGLPITEENLWSHDDKGQIELGGASLLDTWRGLEECVRLGLVKNIGVSNYSAALIVDLVNYARIKPSVNQCEAHVYNTRHQLRDICNMYGIHFTMYSILGSGKEGPLQDETVKRIAEKHTATPAQILVAWGISTGCSVLAKSGKPKRVAENFKSQDIKLSKDEVDTLSALDRKQMVCNMEEYWGFASHV